MKPSKENPIKAPQDDAKAAKAPLGDKIPAGHPVRIQKPPMFSTERTMLDVAMSDSFSGGWVRGVNK